MAEIRLLELRNTTKWGGGPDKTILLSAERHDPARVSVVVAYIRDVRDQEFQITAKAKARGLTYYEIPERGKFDVRVIREICNLVIRHDINLIHSHDYKSDLFAYLARWWLWRRRIFLISTAHACVMMGLRGTIYRHLSMFLMRRFDHLIAVAHATKDEMVASGIRESSISVIHNAIDTEAWSREHVTMNSRDELRLGRAFPVVGYVGRIMPEKDLYTWLRAAALVAQQYRDARFVLVGDGRDGTTLGDLQVLAATLGIADRVVFPGYRSDLLPVYATFDLFVLSSLREGLPNSILEAMALGLPVVTTDVAGTKELVMHDQTGFVVAQRDVNGMAQAMLAILGNEQRRVQMGQAGRTRVESQFSFTQRMHRIEDLYAQILELPAGRCSPSRVATAT